MAEPWEDYQPASKDSAPGPWQDYAKPAKQKVGAYAEKLRASGFPMESPKYSPGVAQMVAGGKDIASGKAARGAHEIISGVGTVSAPVAAMALPIAPVATLTGAAGSLAGGAAGKVGGSFAGLSEDQSDLAGDVGAIAGGYAGAKLGPGSKWLSNLAEKLKLRKAPVPTPEAPKTSPYAMRNVETPELKPSAAQPYAMRPTQTPQPAAPGAQPYVMRSISSGTTTQPSPKAAASLPEPKTKAPTGSTAPVNASAKPMPGQPVPEASEAGEAIQAQILGKVLRQAKIRPDDAAKIKPEEWAVIAKQAKVGAPSEKVARLALEENRKLWAASQKDLEARRAAHFAKNPKQ